MLPFVPENNQRKWSCFVCGYVFNDFAEFKEHIFEKHEEGREYIKCPLSRCNTPVRDLRLHYKACHPSETMPKAIQMKCTVWHDVKNPGAKRKKKPVFEEGYFESQKNGGQMMHFRSGYERKVYQYLEDIDYIEGYQVEAFKVPYTWKGKRRNYIPDLIVKYMDGSIEVWEIKPGNQTMLEQNQFKWDSCDAYCKTHGWKFVIMTETGITKLWKESNKKSIHD